MGSSRETVDEIRRRADIVTTISKYLNLRKQGKRYLGLCPFHGEKTPSFSVSPEKGLFYCFGCHQSGDVFTFVMEHEHVSFPEAVRRLGESVGVNVAPRSKAEQAREQRDQKLIEVNQIAREIFTKWLWRQDDDGAGRARGYLDRDRALPASVARESGLGYCGDSAKLLTAFNEREIPLDRIAEAGLLTDDRQRCLFEDRLVFPIVDLRQQVVGFGARALSDAQRAKYINTRETPMFRKSAQLYGVDRAQDTARKSRRLVLVEGYTDVIACRRAGVTDAVAALGTAFTTEHASVMHDLLGNDAKVVLALDGDAAGVRASRKAALALIRTTLKPLVALLPGGDDPDSIVRRGDGDTLRTAIDDARQAIEYFIERAFEGSELGVEERAAAATEIGPLIAALDSGLERDLYYNRLAASVGVSEAQLQRHLAESARDNRVTNNPRSPQPEPPMPSMPPPQTEPPYFDSPPTFSPYALQGEDPRRAAQPIVDSPSVEKKPVPRRAEIDWLRQLLLHPQLRAHLKELVESAPAGALSPATVSLWTEIGGSESEIVPLLRQHLPPRWAEELAGCAGLEVKREADDERSEAGEKKGADGAAETDAAAKKTLEDIAASIEETHIEQQQEEITRKIVQVGHSGADASELLRRKRALESRRRELKRRRGGR